MGGIHKFDSSKFNVYKHILGICDCKLGTLCQSYMEDSLPMAWRAQESFTAAESPYPPSQLFHSSPICNWGFFTPILFGISWFDWGHFEVEQKQKCLKSCMLHSHNLYSLLFGQNVPVTPSCAQMFGDIWLAGVVPVNMCVVYFEMCAVALAAAIKLWVVLSFLP